MQIKSFIPKILIYIMYLFTVNWAFDRYLRYQLGEYQFLDFLTCS